MAPGYDPALTRTVPGSNQDSGLHLAQQLAAHHEPPDALVCASDDLAAGAILGLRERGLRVPEDISIIGFDDRPFAAHLPIPLTTIALPLYDMGVQAAERLFTALADRHLQHEIIRVPAGSSSGGPAAPRPPNPAAAAPEID